MIILYPWLIVSLIIFLYSFIVFDYKFHLILEKSFKQWWNTSHGKFVVKDEIYFTLFIVFLWPFCLIFGLYARYNVNKINKKLDSRNDIK